MASLFRSNMEVEIIGSMMDSLKSWCIKLLFTFMCFPLTIMFLTYTKL